MSIDGVPPMRPVLVLHQLPEGMGLYPGLHHDDVGLAAIILNLVRSLTTAWSPPVPGPCGGSWHIHNSDCSCRRSYRYRYLKVTAISLLCSGLYILGMENAFFLYPGHVLLLDGEENIYPSPIFFTIPFMPEIYLLILRSEGSQKGSCRTSSTLSGPRLNYQVNQAATSWSLITVRLRVCVSSADRRP